MIGNYINKKLINFDLPELTTRYSSNVISKIISLTIGLVLFFIVLASIIIIIVKIDVTIDSNGQLEPKNLIYLYSPLNGKINKLFINEGGTFNKDDLIVQFDSIRIKDQIDKLKSEFITKKNNYRIKIFSINHEIKENDLLHKQAQSQLLKANANLRQKMYDYFPGVNPDSFLVAYKKGSHIAMDYAIADVIAAESNVESIQSNEDILKVRDIEIKSLLLEIQQLEKDIVRQKEYLLQTKLKAPFDGAALSDDLKKYEGAFVGEGAYLFPICEKGNWKAYLNVSENDVFELAIGDSVKIEIKAMKQSDEFLLIPGRVISISSEPIKVTQAENSSQKYKLEVAINMIDARK
jgi:multidrug resistance efflux pump